jgi:hypothetical protein
VTRATSSGAPPAARTIADDVAESLAELRGEIARADELAVAVPADLARDEEVLAPRRREHAVAVPFGRGQPAGSMGFIRARAGSLTVFANGAATFCHSRDRCDKQSLHRSQKP